MLTWIDECRDVKGYRNVDDRVGRNKSARRHDAEKTSGPTSSRSFFVVGPMTRRRSQPWLLDLAPIWSRGLARSSATRPCEIRDKKYLRIPLFVHVYLVVLSFAVSIRMVKIRTAFKISRMILWLIQVVTCVWNWYKRYDSRRRMCMRFLILGGDRLVELDYFSFYIYFLGHNKPFLILMLSIRNLSQNYPYFFTDNLYGFGYRSKNILNVCFRIVIIRYVNWRKN